MGMWGTPSVPKALLLLALLFPPAFTIRCYTDLAATRVTSPYSTGFITATQLLKSV